MRTTAVLLVLLGAVLAGLTTPSKAQAIAQCDVAFGSYSNNQWAAGATELNFHNVFYSYWLSNKDYNAYRIRGDGSTAYHHYQDVSAFGGESDFQNSIDVFRSTRMQRGGYTAASWEMEHYRQGASC